MSYVELLMDLLEHEDLTVGVMASQIMTELHSLDGPLLESQIQKCPDGMNKLLQRLPDTSREEVRNQAIVLIQQLTSKNEEMKKTVAFNEGFEIIFGIIKSEGGSVEPSYVTVDCLQICKNVLIDTETCQRLFFGMGQGWILNLIDFFDPKQLEELTKISVLDDDDVDQSVDSTLWFSEATRLTCAILAVQSLNGALSIAGNTNTKTNTHTNTNTNTNTNAKTNTNTNTTLILH